MWKKLIARNPPPKKTVKQVQRLLESEKQVHSKQARIQGFPDLKQHEMQLVWEIS